MTIATDEQLEYLDQLRDSGVMNMFGAVPCIQRRWPELSREEAANVLAHWMETFSERHKSA